MTIEDLSPTCCYYCKHYEELSGACRRYPPVPSLSHSGGMRMIRAVVNHASLVIVESAFPVTRPDSTCGEWANHRPELAS